MMFTVSNTSTWAPSARNEEIKGKELLKNWVFNLERRGQRSRNIALAGDLIEYIVTKRLPVFGCVCFEKELQRFQVDDVTALDKTFFFLFERIDMWMKIHRRDEVACVIFDDRDYGINQKNSEAITNFFQRSPKGLALDSIVKTPFFAISQSQNVGLQLADLVTTVIGLRFSSHRQIEPYFKALNQAIPSYTTEEGWRKSCLKIMREAGKKRGVPGSLSSRSRVKKAQRPAFRESFMPPRNLSGADTRQGRGPRGEGAKQKRRVAIRPAVGSRKPNTQRSLTIGNCKTRCNSFIDTFRRCPGSFQEGFDHKVIGRNRRLPFRTGVIAPPPRTSSGIGHRNRSASGRTSRCHSVKAERLLEQKLSMVTRESRPEAPKYDARNLRISERLRREKALSLKAIAARVRLDCWRSANANLHVYMKRPHSGDTQPTLGL